MKHLIYELIFDQPVEEVAKLMSRPFYMDSIKAKKFGVIDKVWVFLYYMVSVVFL